MVKTGNYPKQREHHIEWLVWVAERNRLESLSMKGRWKVSINSFLKFQDIRARREF